MFALSEYQIFSDRITEFMLASQDFQALVLREFLFEQLKGQVNHFNNNNGFQYL